MSQSPTSQHDQTTYPAKQLAAGALFCPDCRVRLAEPATVCPSCGFTGQRTLTLFPGGAPPMLPFMDQAECWSLSNQKKLLSWITSMRRLFPQIHWCLLTIELPKESRLRLFNFWFFNVSPLSPGEDAEQRAWTILLTHDVANQRLAVTPGYKVEPLLADDSWEQVMVMMKKNYQEKGALRAYREFFLDCEIALRAASHRMQERLQKREGGRE